MDKKLLPLSENVCSLNPSTNERAETISFRERAAQAERTKILSFVFQKLLLKNCGFALFGASIYLPFKTILFKFFLPAKREFRIVFTQIFTKQLSIVSNPRPIHFFLSSSRYRMYRI